MMREVVSLWLMPRDNKIQNYNFFPKMSKCVFLFGFIIFLAFRTVKLTDAN